VQDNPIRPKLKTPGTERVETEINVKLLPSFAFEINLRHCSTVFLTASSLFILPFAAAEVGRYRLTVSKPALKARLVSALETKT
jgi:hypothetical protein